MAATAGAQTEAVSEAQAVRRACHGNFSPAISAYRLVARHAAPGGSVLRQRCSRPAIFDGHLLHLTQSERRPGCEVRQEVEVLQELTRVIAASASWYTVFRCSFSWALARVTKPPDSSQRRKTT